MVPWRSRIAAATSSTRAIFGPSSSGAGSTSIVSPPRSALGVCPIFAAPPFRAPCRNACSIQTDALQTGDPSTRFETRDDEPPGGPACVDQLLGGQTLSLIHISEPTRLGMISYAV